jgi:hypothetical protein
VFTLYLALGLDQRLHDLGFLGAHVLIGVGDPPEQIRELREVSGAGRFNLVECIEQLAQRALRADRLVVEAQPRSNA